MKTFKVGMEITNTFFIEANSPEEAEAKALDLGVFETLDGAEYDVVEVSNENQDYTSR